MAKMPGFMLVDDDPIFLAVAESVVRALGAEHVATASDGEQALAILDRTDAPFDVIVLDLNMPKLDGLAFMRAVGSRGFAGDVIISSGESEAILQSARRMAALVGVRVLGALRKPISVEALTALLDSRQERSRERPRAAAMPRLDCLSSSQVLPYYQPQYAIATGALAGFEALVRVVSPAGQVFGPGHLFGAIEDPAELVSVSVDIAAKVLADMAAWRRDGLQSRVSINLDANVMEQRDVAATLNGMVRDNGLSPDMVCLELTETALPSDISHLVEVLTRLRMSGFHLSLDDYGTGSSNYELLRLCPFSEIKIDTSILQAAAVDAMSRRFMEVACGMAGDLGMLVVGEGIETAAHLEVARAAGIDVAQGFLFSRAVPEQEARELLGKGSLRGLAALNALEARAS